jgi:uncharacterized membrane protein YraQ (UPF0718 family)
MLVSVPPYLLIGIGTVSYIEAYLPRELGARYLTSCSTQFMPISSSRSFLSGWD